MEINVEARDLDETLKNQIVPLQDYAAMVVETDDEAAYATDIVNQIKAYEKKVTEFFGEDKKLASKLHKNICAKEKAALEPAVLIRTAISAKVSGYLTAKRKAEEAARAEAERVRKEAEDAEKKRLADIAEAKRLEALKAAEEGNKEQAAALADEAAQIQEAAETTVFIPEVMPEVAKSISADSGKLTGRSDIKITVTDKKALVDALFARGLEAFIDIDMNKLKRHCKDTKAKFDGLAVEEVVNASFRASA